MSGVIGVHPQVAGHAAVRLSRSAAACRVGFYRLGLPAAPAVASFSHPESAISGRNCVLIASAYITAPLRLGCPIAAIRQSISRLSRNLLSSLVSPGMGLKISLQLWSR